MLSMNITSVSDQQNTLFYFIISSNTIMKGKYFNPNYNFLKEVIVQCEEKVP